MSAAHARPGGEPSGRPWRAAKRAKLRRAGRLGAHDDSDKTRVTPAAPADLPPQSPLDFAESVFRDPTQPMALRAKMAQVAMAYRHGRWRALNSDEPARPKLPPFDLPDPFNSLSVPLRDAIAPGAAPVAEHKAQEVMKQHALAAEARAREMEERAIAAETMLARVENERPESRNDSEAARAGNAAQTADAREAPAQLAEAEERARALEKRAVAAEGKLREAEHRARDMEQRALAAEALIAGRR